MKLVYTYVAVALGGALGGAFRFILTIIFPFHNWPWGIFTANLGGCFLLGFLTPILQLKKSIPLAVKKGITVGLIGGFTTMSTFAADTIAMLKNGHLLGGSVYLLATVTGGMGFVTLGFVLGARGRTR
ncbi:putative fluoride ion transporter CrcB [Shouchella clausii]|uniref:fluoride efflux transporter FluC n=1 Tax=Shouchella clausii TaxID=79880 RepID=UPI000BA51FFE|nr:CrcB family protein [Shouchella clausii]PAD46140.1 hypothetical protein CHI09_13925 [Shouchella clausii]PAF07926.1 hypothetical protein CHH65_18350 [Shouchella clausii]GIN18254.1 putative fluoride ion transporter CrcB [Shouchella clausii]